MEIVPFIVFYNGISTGPCIKRCIDHLSANGPSTYGNAIKRIDLYPRCQTRDQRTPGLEAMMERFQLGLKTLPFIKFRRNIGLCEISYESKWMHSSEIFGESVVELPSSEFNYLCREFMTALLLVRKRLKDSDDFDLEAFEKQLRRRIDVLPTGTD